MAIDRVFTSEEKDEIFDKMSKTKQKNSGIFLNNKDLFLFALSLGYKHKQRRPLKKRKAEIHLSVFQRGKNNIDFIDLIALSETKDIYILDWEDEEVVNKKLKIIEEYANGGLEIIYQKIINNNTDIYDNLLQLINIELDNNLKNNISELKNIVGMI